MSYVPSAPPVGDEIFLLKMGEMVLKGLNRRTFEERLMGNARRRLQKLRQVPHLLPPVHHLRGAQGAPGATWTGPLRPSPAVFGVVGLSRAKACEKTPEAILETAKTYLHDDLMAARTFKVESKRADKTFPMTSIQLSQYVGGELDEAFPHIQADMHHPELTVHVEVRDFAAYVHGDPDPGAGGLPVGVGGKAVSLLSGGIDSPVASWMMAKRGVALEMVHFFSYPYTSPEAKDKVLDPGPAPDPLVRAAHRPRGALHQDSGASSRLHCPEALFTLLMRRFMMRISERVAQRVGAHGLITGESLGQVASQTMEAMAVTGQVCTLPVFRPLVGMDKEEIVRTARKIGTFETSILPYEDCCTVFTPRHPKTHPKLEEITEAEAALDIEALVEEAVQGIERVVLDP